MAFEEKKYLDINGVGVIKSYIDQQDNFKVDKTTYADDKAAHDELYNKVVADLAAEVKRSTEADTEHAAGISANATAVAQAQADATKANEDLAKEVDRATKAEGVNAQAAADALAEAQAKVASVSNGDASISVGGTATAPTVAVKLSNTANNALTVDDNGLYVSVPDCPTYSVVKDENAGEYAAVYHLTKDGANVGAAINIPKDMVVQSGSVVTNPTGQPAGTYIEIVLANATNDKIYVPVDSLIEYVTSGSAETDAVVINIDADHKVTATITDGSIAKAKLESAVQTSLNKADSALQEANIATGTTNGTIAVGSKEVAVAGLKSAAYEEASAFDAAGSAQAAYDAIVPLTVAEVKGVFGLA